MILFADKFKTLNEITNNVEINFEELAIMLENDDRSKIIKSNGLLFSDQELDALLDRSELYEQLSKTD